MALKNEKVFSGFFNEQLICFCLFFLFWTCAGFLMFTVIYVIKEVQHFYGQSLQMSDHGATPGHSKDSPGPRLVATF